MDEAELLWPCYECSQKFRTSSLLQTHLTEHDDVKAPSTTSAVSREDGGRTPGRRRGRPATRNVSTTGEQDDEDDSQVESCVDIDDTSLR